MAQSIPLCPAFSASIGCRQFGVHKSAASTAPDLPLYSSPLHSLSRVYQRSFLGLLLHQRSAQAAHGTRDRPVPSIQGRSAAPTAERAPLPRMPDKGALFEHESADVRRSAGPTLVQLPGYSEYVQPGSTLGLPSRTTWTPVKLPSSFLELAQALGSPSFQEALSGPQAALHSAYFAARTAYFLNQSSGPTSRLLGYILNATALDIHPFNESIPLILGSLMELHRMDQENVRRGFYRAPYDMDIWHRQWSPAEWLDKQMKLVDEFVGSRKLRERGERKKRNAQELAEHYPEYYLQNFHWQMGGWLEDRSAQIYDYSTESLFWGAQDMMHRQTLVPLHYYMHDKDPADVSVLDLACGTGRFLTFLADNYPTAQKYGVDLSPNYLKVAEENMDYFRNFDTRVNGQRRLAGTRFIQANAEQIPLPNESLDVVTCIYLFHELPPAARRNVIKEAARVLKPGGIFVWTDSFQKGDLPEMEMFGPSFSVKFHEPYYLSFRSTDFKKLFAAEGLSHESTILAHLSKVMCFRKIADSAG